MLENVLEVGERPEDLIVYASLAKAVRDWPAYDATVTALRSIDVGQTLVMQSGKPIGILDTSPDAPMVISAVNNTVGNWATPEKFYERYDAGDTIWGGLTAAAWQYIGRQGVLQGTYELLRRVGERHFGSAEALSGRWMLTAGLGGMGSAQPISAAMLGLSSITVEVDPAKLAKQRQAGGLHLVVETLAAALDELQRALAANETISIGLLGNAATIFPEVARGDVLPDIVTDQTAAHDVRFGYLPEGYDLDAWFEARVTTPGVVENDARASIGRQVTAMLQLVERGAIAFENGNNIRVQAELSGVAAAFSIPGFMENYLRPLFARGIGPFRWVALSGDPRDLEVLDDLARTLFPGRPEVAAWIDLAQRHVPVQGLPARSCWLGHGERSMMALAANDAVADGRLSAPVLFTRDHLDAAGMTHPRIGTESMLDGSDGVTDWPLLDAMALSAAGADLVAIHSGGGGYSGWMQSAGMSIIADGEPSTRARLRRALDSDTGIGVLRYATAGYADAAKAAHNGGETGQSPLSWLE
jgi:urocanate hydratase